MKCVRMMAMVGAFLLTAQPAGALPPDPKPFARIDQFIPQGLVKGVRQVTVRFSTPMVALGDPRLPDPMEITCPVTGKGRWTALGLRFR